MPLRHVIATAALAMLPLSTPASAISTAEKMDICKFGADDQKLTGAKRKTFISKCMADVPLRRAKTQQK